MAQNITADELFGRIRELLTATDLQPATRNSMMHEVLVLCCHEGVRDTEQSFGNLFSQVDFLCKRHRVGVSDKADIQTMRRHSNGSEPLAREELLYDGRALSIFVSAVMGKDIPSGLTEISSPAPNGAGNQQPAGALRGGRLGRQLPLRHPGWGDGR